MKTVFRGLIACSAVLLLILIAGGLWFFLSQEQPLRHKVEGELQSIAELKVNQIVRWREELLADARVISENPLLTAPLGQWLASPNPGSAGRMLTWFHSLQHQLQYTEVLLVDPRGQVLLSLSGQTGKIGAMAVETLATAVRQHRVVLSHLHQGNESDDAPHLDTIVTLVAVEDGGATVVGGLILRGDASRFL